MIMIGNKFKLSPRFLTELSRKSKIAIVGAAGVGKTTLLNELFELDLITEQFNKIPEVVRTLCAQRGYKSPYDIPEDQVHQFREDVLDKQIALEDEQDNFIVDRSCLDAWLYYMRWSWNSVDVEDSERFFKKAFTQTKKYDALIYVPISFELEDDGFRWNNKTYQKQMDRMFREYFRAWDLDLLFLD
jgi:predicted ATPase